MAIGAIRAMKSAGVDTEKMFVGGVDATQDRLAAMKAGDLKVAVFPGAMGQVRTQSMRRSPLPVGNLSRRRSTSHSSS